MATLTKAQRAALSLCLSDGEYAFTSSPKAKSEACDSAIPHGRAIASLEAKGLIVVTLGEHDAADRLGMYSIADAGREALEAKPAPRRKAATLKLSEPMRQALDTLGDSRCGFLIIGKHSGVKVQTAKALERRGLAVVSGSCLYTLAAYDVEKQRRERQLTEAIGRQLEASRDAAAMASFVLVKLDELDAERVARAELAELATA